MVHHERPTSPGIRRTEKDTMPRIADPRVPPRTPGEPPWTVGQVAEAAGVTVRTLHHYDEIGLLHPSARSPAGYRLYAEGDVRRLHDIVLLRSLELPLDAVDRLLEAPREERVEVLRRQRRRLSERARRTERLIRAVDRAIETLQRGETMDRTTLFESFDGFDPAEHAREAEGRWGDTDAWAEARDRTASYGEADWAGMRRDQDEVEATFARLLDEGREPAGAEARAAAEAHRRHIERWFYPCSPAMHVGLAEMYRTDPRFRAHYDDRAPGLADFVAAAIRANAEEPAEEGPST